MAIADDWENHDESWLEYKAEIRKRLDTARPQRVGPGETDWRQPVYGWARNHIPDESNLVRHFAEEIVNSQEGQATKRGNREVRRYMHGQMPLMWGDLGPLPIVLPDGLRVRLDAATPDDFDRAAALAQKRGKQTFDEVLLYAEGLRELARDARTHGFATVSQLGDLPQRGSHLDAPPDLDWDDEHDDDF